MDRVYAHAVVAHLVVEVRGERKARVARKGDDVAAADALSAADVGFRKVAVRGFVTVAVVDDHRQAVCGISGCHVAHHAVGRGEDARTLGNGVIDTLMRLQGLVEGVYAHAVGGREQRELLVDYGLDRRNAVAVAACGIDTLLQGQVGGVQACELLLHVGDTVAEFALETAGRAVHDLLVGEALLLLVFRVEVVGIRFEEDAEDAAVALPEVVEDGLQGVVTLREVLVFALEPVRGVLHLVFDRCVEEDRETDIIKHDHSDPYEQMDRHTDDPLPAAAAFAEFCEIFLSGHVNTFRSWSPAGSP